MQLPTAELSSELASIRTETVIEIDFVSDGVRLYTQTSWRVITQRAPLCAALRRRALIRAKNKTKQ